jgi:hypothetical protein
LKSEHKIPSEVEQGKHSLVRVKKDTLDQISRNHHRYFYEQLFSGGFATTEK